MKRFNFIYLFLAVVGVLSLASCEHKYADYTPGSADKNTGVYFPSTAALAVTAEDTSVEIPVARLNADAEATVTFRAEDVSESGLFTIPNEVKFAAGEAESKIVINFDGTELVTGIKYPVKIKLAEEEASSYAISEYTFNIYIPEPWNSMGQGIYFDDLLWTILDGGEMYQGVGAYVEFQQHALEPNRIRAVNVYAPETIGTMWGGVPQFMTFTAGEETTYVEFDITDPNNVKFGEVYTDSEAGNAQVVYLNIKVVGDQQGTLYDLACLVWESAGPVVLKDGVITFPTQGVELAAFKDGAYAGYFGIGNTAGYMQYYLPGTEFVNYDMAVTYDGMYVSADGTTASAIFNFAFGADVATYKFAFLPGDITADPAEAIEAIVAGSSDLKIYEGDVDTKRWEVELTKGVYTLVAVPYSAEGEAKADNAIAYNFYFNGTGDMPEVNVEVEVNTPAYFAEEDKKAEVEAESPACFNVACKVVADASQLKAVKYWYGNAEALVSQKVDDDTLFANYAGDASKIIEKIAENGAALMTFNVTAETPNFVVKLRFETIYGTNVDKTIEYELPKYDGTFPVGAYKFTEGDYEEVFTIVPAKSYTTFFWTNSTFDGSSWYCDFNPETSILTMDGILFNYEDEGSQFGKLYGYYNQEGTLVYSYQSSDNAEFNGMAPLQLSVADGAMALKTYYGAAIFNYTAEDQSFTGQFHFLFTPEATIEPYVEEEAPATSAKVLSVAADKVDYAGVKAVMAERVEVVKPMAATPLGSMKPATLKR
ncbi:MAG: hypothetical protein IKB15_02005 [Alistipes sp.]|nr:hypothetical protein [Alistipes sp.]